MSGFVLYLRFPSSAWGIISVSSGCFRLQRPAFFEPSLVEQQFCKVKGKHLKTEEHFCLQSASDGHAVYPIFSSQNRGYGLNTVPDSPNQLHGLVIFSADGFFCMSQRTKGNDEHCCTCFDLYVAFFTMGAVFTTAAWKGCAD